MWLNLSSLLCSFSLFLFFLGLSISVRFCFTVLSFSFRLPILHFVLLPPPSPPRFISSSSSSSELTPDVFNAHFFSVVSKFLPDDQTEGSQYSCPDKLLNFCIDRTSQSATFSIPPIGVLQAGVSVWKTDNKKATGCDGISFKLLKLPFLVLLKHLHIFISHAYKGMFFHLHRRELK